MQISQEINGQFPPPCVDNSTILEENLSKNADNEQNNNQSGDLELQNQNKASKNGENSTEVSFEACVERDFNDFEVIYPNISKDTLLKDENLRIFAQGKENKPLSVLYAQFTQLVCKIGAEAIKQEKLRQNNAQSSVGGLSGANNGDSVFFTREQVQRMSPSEIKRNFTRIRESQARW